MEGNVRQSEGRNQLVTGTDGIKHLGSLGGVTQASGNKLLQWQCCQSYFLSKRAECLLYASVILGSQKNLEIVTGCAVNNADVESTVAMECL